VGKKIPYIVTVLVVEDPRTGSRKKILFIGWVYCEVARKNPPLNSPKSTKIALSD